MADADGRGQAGRLGRLFAALVGNEAEAGASELPDALDAVGGSGRQTSSLDVEALARSLSGSHDPMGALRGVVANVRRRSEAPDGDEPAPNDFELYLASRLADAGLMDRETPLPSVSVVRPHTSDLLYLRINDETIPWLSKVRVLRVEAALNAALLADRSLPDANAADMASLVRCEQRVARSVISQASRAAARVGGGAYGEWAVRTALSSGIECLRLPHRLTARFRTNVAAGLAAFEIDLVVPRAWPMTAFVDGLGVVASSPGMRRRAVSDYNLRLGVLLAAYALMVAPQLGEVWVAGVVDTPAGHACYYSARLGRSLVEALDLDGSVDPFAVMRDAGAAVDVYNGELRAVRQGFSLDDERLCPASRHVPPELSDEALLPVAARALGCSRVRDLGIDEACARRRAAEETGRRLTQSTQDNVRALLELASNAPEDVRAAAMRCVGELIDGTLADEPFAIAEALVAGDPLSRAAASAHELVARDEDERARQRLEDALRAVDESGAYADGDGVAWRSFGNYAERALYNRLLAPAHEQVRLVPLPYLDALLTLSGLRLESGDAEGALELARRAREVAPMSPSASSHLSACLEVAGRSDEAVEECCRLLSLAHDPQVISYTYLRLAQILWQDGQVLAARACYQRARQNPSVAGVFAMFVVVRMISHVDEAAGASLSDEQVEDALRGAGITVAPTDEVGDALFEAARASLDAGVFHVGRELVRALCSLVRDDVTFGVLRSIEGEPDR